MKNYSLSDFKLLNVDDEKLFVSDDVKVLIDFLEGAFLDGQIISPSLMELTASRYDIIKNYNELQLAFHRGLFSRGMWWPCTLINFNGRKYRIHLRNETCPKCDWTGIIGTPSCDDIYIGARDSQKAFENSHSLPAVNCPSCVASFKSSVVWIEPINNRK